MVTNAVMSSPIKDFEQNYRWRRQERGFNACVALRFYRHARCSSRRFKERLLCGPVTADRVFFKPSHAPGRMSQDRTTTGWEYHKIEPGLAAEKKSRHRTGTGVKKNTHRTEPGQVDEQEKFHIIIRQPPLANAHYCTWQLSCRYRSREKHPTSIKNAKSG